MARKFNQTTLAVLETLRNYPEGQIAKNLYQELGLKTSYKDFYNILFRLAEMGFVTKFKKANSGLSLNLTAEGAKTLLRKKPVSDGVWKLVIFDIPEKHKKVRAILRAKLKQLHFKKWQNSIWVSPYELDAEIETEFKNLAEKFFVRLIKATDINVTDDLEKMFKTTS